MVLSFFWTGMLAFSLMASLFCGTADALATAALEGAKSGVTLMLSMAGALCLWSGLLKVMEQSGITSLLAKFFRPLLGRLFPKTATDERAMGYLCGNFTANLLGLGNAATPMGIKAVERMGEISHSAHATDEMIRLVVLNTASVQLIPSTVCALRASLGAAAPFRILPAVWLTSILSVSAGLFAAGCFGRFFRRA